MSVLVWRVESGLISLVKLGSVTLWRPEVNIKPWENLLNDLKEGNKKTRWMDREPYAYWKGNPVVAETRQDLMRCNVSEQQDWSARVYAQVNIRLFPSLFISSFSLACNRNWNCFFQCESLFEHCFLSNIFNLSPFLL